MYFYNRNNTFFILYVVIIDIDSTITDTKKVFTTTVALITSRNRNLPHRNQWIDLEIHDENILESYWVRKHYPFSAWSLLKGQVHLYKSAAESYRIV